MASKFFIAVRSDRFNDEILLETQGDLPIGELLTDILKILNWPIEVNGKCIDYTLRTEEKELQKMDTLISAGMEPFEEIWISPVENGKGSEPKPPAAKEPSPVTPMGEPFWALIPVERPTLIHPEGFLFVLDKLPALIGRRGGERPVQIDLTEFEKEKLISSRCHAEIFRDRGGYYLRAYPTRNGTFVGRDELRAGETRLLNNHDALQFGVEGVRLIFRTPVAE